MTTALLSEVGRGEVAARSTIGSVPLSPEEVGRRIVRAREQKEPKPWSQFDLALALGVSPSTIYRWEKGKLPSMNELIRLAEVLDKPLDYITEPPERQVALSDIGQTLEEIRLPLEELRVGATRTREGVLEALASIDARLSRIEEQLGLQDDLGQVHPT